MIRILSTRLLLAAPLLFATLMVTGCETKEKIVDIETPSGEVEATRDTDTGEVEVEVNKE